MAKYFPILVNIKDKKCVIVGGGPVGERKIKTLLKYGAKITLISPETTDKIKELINRGKINYINREYKKGDLEDAFLVVAATSSSKINRQIARDAYYLVNIVEKGDFQENMNNISYTVPAIYEMDDLTIAISTDFPALSKLLKDEIAQNYGKEFAKYLKYLKKIRREIKQKIADNKRRQKIFRKIASKKIVSILRQKGFEEAKREIEKIINET
ncbi:MAG: bifunctional precorrin-2 dehydrogenase/sirohydrochlorin ferrochelatase [Thermodesulfovibrio sp.]|nr:bifunctional precorrin-2 dehydrogenase/sirohydrochlorin ferrochelatase [Thermodesulfovibrio sp.]